MVEVPLHLALALFGVGVVVGLIFGPDSEREHRAKVDGWLSGFQYARENPDRAHLQEREG